MDIKQNGLNTVTLFWQQQKTEFTMISWFCMGGEKNPGPIKNENNIKVNTYIDQRKSYNSSILINLRKKAIKPMSEIII